MSSREVFSSRPDEVDIDIKEYGKMMKILTLLVYSITTILSPVLILSSEHPLKPGAAPFLSAFEIETTHSFKCNMDYTYLFLATDPLAWPCLGTNLYSLFYKNCTS